MEIKATVYKVNEIQVVSEKFKKKEVIVKVGGDQYPDYLTMQLTNDKCELIGISDIGNEVTVSINLKGRLWTNKEGKEVSFNTLEVWKVDKF